MAVSSERQAVLLAVHEQLQLGSKEQEWTREQWHAAFHSLFYMDAHKTHDDLLFFVKQPGQQGSPCTSFLVQRKTAEMPSHLSISGQHFPSIAWPETVALNLVIQATFELTVTSCRQDLLLRVAEGVDVSGEAVAVTKQVYASPSRTSVNLDDGKAQAEPSPAYPDIFFSVENYDEAFMDLVLRQADDCFCVVLKAKFPAAATPSPDSGGSSQALTRDIVLFSGFVVHQQIYEHLGPKLRPPLAGITALLGRLFGNKPPGPLQRHAVHMRGPGGVGHAQVAVAAVEQPTPAGPAPAPAAEGEDRDKAFSSPAPTQWLQCALVTMSVPVDVLAANILAGHKESAG